MGEHEDHPLAHAVDDESAWQQVVRGYRLAGLLVSAHRLGLLRELAHGEVPLGKLAADLVADEQLTDQMCRALRGAGLVEEGTTGWRLSDAGAALTEDAAAVVELDAMSEDYLRWGQLDRHARDLAVGESEPPVYREAPQARKDTGSARRYALRLAALHREQARRLIARLEPERPVRVLDAAGADGHVAREICRHWPQAHCIVLEQPAMAEVARQACADEARITVIEGDLLKPDGYRIGALEEPVDVVIMSHVLQGLCEEDQRDLVLRAVKTLAPGGCLISSEFVLRYDERGPLDVLLWSVGQAAGQTGGNLLTSIEQDTLLRGSGLAAAGEWWVADSTRAVMGVKTAAGVSPALLPRRMRT